MSCGIQIRATALHNKDKPEEWACQVQVFPLSREVVEALGHHLMEETQKWLIANNVIEPDAQKLDLTAKGPLQ